MEIKGLFKEFFEEKKVFITGHTGFIGSWLAIFLNELGAKVCGYALPPNTNKDNFVVTQLQNKIKNIFGDVRDLDKLNKTIEDFQPEIIFHLAAQAIVRKSYLLPKETYDINVGGTINVFEAFRKNNSCKVLINMTSDKCYENQEWIWGYRENDRLGGYDPYSSSKACSEIITSAYTRSFFKSQSSQNNKSVASVRSGNVIGGGDWQEDRLIPDCFRAIKKNKEIFIRNPSSVRPWQFVLEPILGYLLLANKLWDGDSNYIGPWNFGPKLDSSITVEEIVKKLISYSGKGKYRSDNSQKIDEFHETGLLLLDSNKSYRYLNWKTVLSIDESIKYICDWYMNDNINYNYDVEQINSYLGKVKNKV